MSESRVKFLDLARLNSSYRDQLIDAAKRVVDSGWYTLGEEVRTFEKSFASYCGVDKCVGVGNGLDALCIILKSYIELGRIAPGDKVVVPSNTFVATALAVSQAGLIPVFVSPNLETFNICTSKLEDALKKGVKAVIAVHLYGQLADVVNIKRLCRQYGALLIEDAAQAHGATINGEKAGSFGDAGAFSFFPGKNLGALGDGGAITTSDAELSEMACSIRNYGSKVKYYHDVHGVNSRLDEIQAAFLMVKLADLDKELQRRQMIAGRYLSEINNDLIMLPKLERRCAHVWHLFVVRSEYRDQFQKHLDRTKIDTLIHYPIALPDQEAYRAVQSHCEVSSLLSSQILSLPIDPNLTTEEIDRVVLACNEFNVSSS